MTELVKRTALCIVNADAEAVEEEINPTSPSWGEYLARAAISEIFNWLENPSEDAKIAGINTVDDSSGRLTMRKYEAMLTQMRKEAGV